VVVQSVHIQHAKLEGDEGLHQHEEQLEEAGMRTVEGLAGENLSGEVVVEQQFDNEEHAEVETVAKWKTKATKEEYVLGGQRYFDAGASLHLSTRQLINTHGAHSRKERRRPLIFSSRIQGVIQALIEDKMEEPNRAFAQAGDKVTINRLTTKWICIRFGAEFPSL
jgi:hypothetical protein